MLTIAKAAPADPSQALPPYTQQEEQPIGGAANPAVSMTGEQSTRSAFTTARFNHDLPQINAQIGDLQILTDLALDALLEANRSRPYIFNLGGSYVRIEELPADDRRIPSVAILTPAKMKYELARVAHWVRIKNGEIFDTQPPARTVTDVLAVPSPPLPILSRVVQVPVFSSNGRLETTPGYHAGSQTYYWPKQGVALLPVSEHPSAEEVSAAKRLLLDDLLADFPFETEADRAHAVALALLPYARNLIFGPTPNHLVESPSPGTGKGLLADVLLRPAVGAIPSLSQIHNEEEWRRTLTGCFAKRREVVLIDNLSTKLDSGTLALALTQEFWEDRIVRSSDVPSFPIRNIWVTTANNPQLSTEIARRSIRIRLNADVEMPWLRTGYKHKDLKHWVEENQAELIWAAQTLIQAWIAAGRPAYSSAKLLGSYEQWSRVIGGILEFAGIPGFLSNLEQFYESEDPDAELWNDFVGRWNTVFGERQVSASDLLTYAKQAGFNPPAASESKIAAQTVWLGHQLRLKRDCVFAGYQVRRAGSKQGTAKWQLRSIRAGK